MPLSHTRRRDGTESHEIPGSVRLRRCDVEPGGSVAAGPKEPRGRGICVAIAGLEVVYPDICTNNIIIAGVMDSPEQHRCGMNEKG
jgi:hypothetical protein